MKGNQKIRSRTSLLAVILVASSGLIGCSNTAELQSLRTQVIQAKADASAAIQDAADAKSLAREAVDTANSAKAAANAANATSMATESKIDRMFKKAMYK